MRIAILHELLGRSRGGIEAWIYHASHELKRNGHSVILVCSQRKVPDDAAPDGVEVVNVTPLKKLPFDRSSFPIAIKVFSYIFLFHKILRHIDIVWSRSPFMAYAASKVFNKRKVVFIHAAPYMAYGKIGFERFKKTCKKNFINVIKIILAEINFIFIKKYELLALKNCINVYLSQSRKTETLEFYGLDDQPGKYLVVPPGVDSERFTPGNNYWNGQSKLYLISVCRLAQDKNIQCILEALSLFKKRGLDVHLTVVGEGPYEEELKMLACDLGLDSNNLMFAGKQKNIEEWYKKAHIFVLPSIYEGFGSVYIEAMSAGLPCIAIKRQLGKYLVASDEIIDDEVNGWLMKENSSKELFEIICRIHENPEKVSIFGKAARDKAVKKFSWNNVMKEMLDITEKDL